MTDTGTMAEGYSNPVVRDLNREMAEEGRRQSTICLCESHGEDQCPRHAKERMGVRATSDDDALWFGIKAIAGEDDLGVICERLVDVLGAEHAGLVIAALCELGEDEIKEGNR